MEPLFDIGPAASLERPDAAVKLTERDMLDLLHQRFGQLSYNGGVAASRYVCAEHVRARAGFDCGTADFMAMDTWRSKLDIHGVEVKVSRSDWLRELKQPEKSEPFREWCTYWWLAAPDTGVAHPDEMPAGWGLLVVRGDRLVAKVAAPRKRWAYTASGPGPSLYPEALAMMPVEVVASLLRATAKTATARAYREGHQAGRAFAQQKAAADV